MSGLGGIWDFTRADEARAALGRIESQLSRRGTAPGVVAHEGPAAMVLRPFPDAASPRAALRPGRLPGGGLLAWDGRLDNADELRRRLDLTPGCPEFTALAAAYERWGRDAPRHMLGDFALAIWDSQIPRLLLARDPMGVRPLFYRWEPGQRVAWGSTLESVLRATGGSGRVDEEWIAGFLTFHTDLHRTPFREVCAVPPGHVLELTPDELTAHECWRPEPTGPLRYRSDREYEEHFSTLFHEAVRRRMACRAPVGAELSGGLDSSSIACVAGALIDEGRTVTRDLRTVSYVYAESTTADERRHIRRVEEVLGRHGHHVVQEEHPLFDRLDEPFYEAPNVLDLTRARWEEVVRHLRTVGAGVVLSGLGGDELLWSEMATPVHLAELLAQRRFRELGRGLAQWSRSSGEPYLHLLYHAVLAPLAPSLHKRSGRRRQKPWRWIDSSFSRRMDLPGRWADARAAPSEASLTPTQREHVAALGGSIRLIAWCYDPGPRPLIAAYPYLDRELVDFCLSLPFDQLVRDGVGRSIQRRALRDRLPRQIAERRTKTTMDEAILRGCAQRWSSIRRILPDPLVCQYGFADPGSVRRVLEETRFGIHRPGAGVLQLLTLEFWLRQQRKKLRQPDRSKAALVRESRSRSVAAT